MPHFKCVGCRIRLHSSGHPADLVGDLCPGCGSLLEPVVKLTEIVGFQSIASSPPGQQRIADRLDGFYARQAKAEAIALLTPEDSR
jgi:hypothetical protein